MFSFAFIKKNHAEDDAWKNARMQPVQRPILYIFPLCFPINITDFFSLFQNRLKKTVCFIYLHLKIRSLSIQVVGSEIFQCKGEGSKIEATSGNYSNQYGCYKVMFYLFKILSFTLHHIGIIYSRQIQTALGLTTRCDPILNYGDLRLYVTLLYFTFTLIYDFQFIN